MNFIFIFISSSDTNLLRKISVKQKIKKRWPKVDLSLHWMQSPNQWICDAVAPIHFLLQLKDAFEVVSDDNASNKTALLAAQQKDEKSSEMIAELTAVSSAVRILSFWTVILSF